MHKFIDKNSSHLRLSALFVRAIENVWNTGTEGSRERTVT